MNGKMTILKQWCEPQSGMNPIIVTVAFLNPRDRFSLFFSTTVGGRIQGEGADRNVPALKKALKGRNLFETLGVYEHPLQVTFCVNKHENQNSNQKYHS